jgi:hypothetical protein
MLTEGSGPDVPGRLGAAIILIHHTDCGIGKASDVWGTIL